MKKQGIFLEARKMGQEKGTKCVRGKRNSIFPKLLTWQVSSSVVSKLDDEFQN